MQNTLLTFVLTALHFGSYIYICQSKQHTKLDTTMVLIVCDLMSKCNNFLQKLNTLTAMYYTYVIQHMLLLRHVFHICNTS